METYMIFNINNDYFLTPAKKRTTKKATTLLDKAVKVTGIDKNAHDYQDKYKKTLKSVKAMSFIGWIEPYSFEGKLFWDIKHTGMTRGGIPACNLHII